ncbi:hypothetical protein Cob_v006129 [Colletotrichum orbiculare MAFF 240422]|uniref:Uncharacterized protein n=1 Tax=Colletotrichum orbiculare (strain 104-T / ATCC 96160 / CBS 514.97 / LARS 414 / MAFF 240422) TaxID=1213857 RepID=A0A484FST4_COLOR|nr:hypothetical protein Cob_v006129 [Colletotrichum orbiculare MAFF 240422]
MLTQEKRLWPAKEKEPSGMARCGEDMVVSQTEWHRWYAEAAKARHGAKCNVQRTGKAGTAGTILSILNWMILFSLPVLP